MRNADSMKDALFQVASFDRAVDACLSADFKSPAIRNPQSKESAITH
jgi:hypothetical protein